MSGEHRCSPWRTEWSEDGGWVCVDCGKPYASAPGGRTRDAREQIARAMLDATVAIAGYRVISPMTADGPLTTGSIKVLTDAVLACPDVADALAEEHHCPTCECIDESCGYVIGTAGCLDWHERHSEDGA